MKQYWTLLKEIRTTSDSVITVIITSLDVYGLFH